MPLFDSQVILDLLNWNVEEFKKDENKEGRELIFWYYDKYLDIVVGKDVWSKQVRVSKLPSDTMDVNGEQKIIVTVSQEAFGLVMLDNCKDKWKNIFDLKAVDSDAEIPKKKGHPDLAKYQGKYSTGTDGATKYGGWSDKGYERLEEIKEELIKHREQEEKDGFPLQKYIRELMKAKYGDPNKKRAAPTKKGGKKASAGPVVKKLKRLME